MLCTAASFVLLGILLSLILKRNRILKQALALKEEELARNKAETEGSRMLYETAALAAHLTIWQYDPVTKRITLGMESGYTRYFSKELNLPHVIENGPETVASHVGESDKAAFIDMYRRLDAGAASAECDFSILIDGIYFSVHAICVAVENKLLGHRIVYGMGQDITSQRIAKESHERELAFLRQVGGPDMVSKGYINLTQNRIIEYTVMNEKGSSTSAGQTWEEVYRFFVEHSDVAPGDRPLAESINREELIRRFQSGESEVSIQYRRFYPDRDPVWMSTLIRFHSSPGSSDVECFAYTYDISQKKLDDEVMRIISEGEFDYFGIININDKSFEMIRKSSAIKFPELHEKTPYSVCCEYVISHYVDAAEKDQFREVTDLLSIENALSSVEHHSATYRRIENGRICCKQLDYFWLDRSEGKILVLRSDITVGYERDQKQLKLIQEAKLEADRANEAKSSFLSSMSHDLRTPLNGIIGFTDLALRTADARKKQDYLEKIRSSGALLASLVDDTLELSRIESGKLVLKPEAVNGRTLVESVITALKPGADLRQIRLSCDLSEVPDETIWIDCLKAQKILLNLLSNAIKYTQNGGEISLRLSALNPPGMDLGQGPCTRRIVITDNGIGMSEEFQARMYEPFAQEHRPESRGVAGTGLGLTIVKRIVGLMGGRIEVWSAPGRGTCFTVDLPVKLCGAGQPAGKSEESHIESRFEGKRVLLCEDNMLNAEIAGTLLAEKAVKVDCAADGEEGLKLFEASPPGYYAAVLMDIRMPRMGGFEATRGIRSMKRSDAASVPIIAMTADAFEEDIKRAMDAGMCGYITKPIDPVKLFEALGLALKA